MAFALIKRMRKQCLQALFLLPLLRAWEQGYFHPEPMHLHFKSEQPESFSSLTE